MNTARDAHISSLHVIKVFMVDCVRDLHDPTDLPSADPKWCSGKDTSFLSMSNLFVM